MDKVLTIISLSSVAGILAMQTPALPLNSISAIRGSNVTPHMWSAAYFTSLSIARYNLSQPQPQVTAASRK